MTNYFGKGSQPLLERNKLTSFDAIWALGTEWFETPNIRRGGWSGVIKYPLKGLNGDNSYIFIKRQENHRSKTWRHPIKGIPTFQREYNNLRYFEQKSIPCPALVYYGSRHYNGNDQAILITQDLATYTSVDNILPDDKLGLIKNQQHRHQLLRRTAEVIRLMHEHHIQHDSLYPKHIFATPVNDGWDVRLIDLEKAKHRLFKKRLVVKELATFRRHTYDWTEQEQSIFFKAYVDETELSEKSKKLWKQAAHRKKSNLGLFYLVPCTETFCNYMFY